MVRDDCGGNLVHPESAVLLGNIDRGEPQFRSLAQQSGQHTGLLGIDVCRSGKNLVASKLGDRCCHLPLFLVQVFGREDLGEAYVSR